QEFAQSRQATPTWKLSTATVRDLDPLATWIVLKERPPAEPEPVTRLREAGLAADSLTRSKLLNLQVPDEGDHGWVKQQLQDWYFQAGARLQRARVLFEVA